MAKPIAVLYYPDGYFDGGSDGRKTPVDVIAKFNTGIPDYHWLCFPQTDITAPELQVFFEKDFTQAKYEELMELVKLNVE